MTAPVRPLALFAIVVGCREQAFLAPCFSALAAQSRPPDAIVFVNNAPEDGCSAWVRNTYPAVHVLDAPRNLGYAGGNNFGIRYAIRKGAGVIFVVNPDVVLAPDCLRTIETAMQGDPGLAQPVLEYPDGQLQSAGNIIHYLGFGCSGHSLPPADSSRVPVAYCSGAALWLDVRVLKEIGPFEERLFFYHEDLELGLRARLSGFTSWCIPGALAIHHHSRTGRFGKKFARMEGNRWFVWLAYLGPTAILLLFPILLLAELAVLLQAFHQGWLLDKLEAMWNLPARRHDIRRLRKQLLKLNANPAGAILPVLSAQLDFPPPVTRLEACANAFSRLLHPLAGILLQTASGGGTRS